jgi:hypothetical protein
MAGGPREYGKGSFRLYNHTDTRNISDFSEPAPIKVFIHLPVIIGEDYPVVGFERRVKMIARIKTIAEAIGAWRVAGEASESDELIECGIRQFGDGMGMTSIMSYPDSDVAEHGDEKVCAA